MDQRQRGLRRRGGSRAGGRREGGQDLASPPGSAVNEPAGFQEPLVEVTLPKGQTLDVSHAQLSASFSG